MAGDFLAMRKKWNVVVPLLAVALSCGTSVSADTLVVGNKGEDTVSFIDLASGAERARVATGRAPHEVAVSPDGRRAAVVAYGGSSIDIFDIATARLVRRIDIAPHAGPHGIIWYRPGRIVAVAERSKALLLIDTDRGTWRSAETGQPGSHMVALSPDRRRAYVSNIMAGTVSEFDVRRMVKLRDLLVGGYPEGLALSPDGQQLWVGDDSGPRLRVVDVASGRVIDTLQTVSIAIRILFSADGRTVVVSNMGSGTLSLFDAADRTLRRTMVVSGSRAAMQVTIAPSRDGKRVFVAETGPGTVAETDLETGQVLRRISAGKNADGLGIAP